MTKDIAAANRLMRYSYKMGVASMLAAIGLMIALATAASAEMHTTTYLINGKIVTCTVTVHGTMQTVNCF